MLNTKIGVLLFKICSITLIVYFLLLILNDRNIVDLVYLAVITICFFKMLVDKIKE